MTPAARVLLLAIFAGLTDPEGFAIALQRARQRREFRAKARAWFARELER